MLHFSPPTRRSTGEITLIVKGEGPGHPFRGNQYKKIGGGKAKLVASASGRKVREEDLEAQNALDGRYGGSVYIAYNVDTYAVHLTRQRDIESLQEGINPERGGGILGTGFYVTPPEGKIGQGRVMQGRDPANPVQVLVQVKMDKVLVLDGQWAEKRRMGRFDEGDFGPTKYIDWVGASEAEKVLQLLGAGHIGPTAKPQFAMRNRAVRRGIGGILYKPDSSSRHPDWDTQICVLDPKTVTIKGVRPLQGGSQGGRAEEANRWQSTMADLMKSMYGRVLLVTPDQFDYYAKVEEKRRIKTAKQQKIAEVLKGEGPGHPFRGNQYRRGQSGGGMSMSHSSTLEGRQPDGSYATTYTTNEGRQILQVEKKDGTIVEHPYGSDGKPMMDVYREVDQQNPDRRTTWVTHSDEAFRKFQTGNNPDLDLSVSSAPIERFERGSEQKWPTRWEGKTVRMVGAGGTDKYDPNSPSKSDLVGKQGVIMDKTGALGAGVYMAVGAEGHANWSRMLYGTRPFYEYEIGFRNVQNVKIDKTGSQRFEGGFLDPKGHDAIFDKSTGNLVVFNPDDVIVKIPTGPQPRYAFKWMPASDPFDRDMGKRVEMFGTVEELAQMKEIRKGEGPGHPFRGNQYVHVGGGSAGLSLSHSSAGQFSEWGERAGEIRAAAAVPGSWTDSDGKPNRELFTSAFASVPPPPGTKYGEMKLHADNPKLGEMSPSRVHLPILSEASGQIVGHIHWEIFPQAGKAKLHLIDIDGDVQAGGFGGKHLHNVENHLIAKDIKSIELTANLDVGGYAWARFGFNFKNPADYRDRAMTMFQRDVPIYEARTRARKTAIGSENSVFDVLTAGGRKFPTAREYSELGKDQKWTDEMGRTMWAGKWFMLNGPSWEAEKILTP